MDQFYDPTDKIKTENRLVENYERFRTLISNLQMGILVESPERIIIQANESFIKLFDIPSVDRLIGMDCGEAAIAASEMFVNPEEFLQRIKEILGERKIITNEELVLTDGRTFERDYVPVDFNNLFYGSMRIYRDITERKELLNNLLNERSLFVTGPTMIFRWQNTKNWPVEYAPDNVVNILGYMLEDLYDGRPAYPSLIHPEDRERVEREIKKNLIDHNLLNFSHEPYRLRNKDGRYIWVQDYTSVKRAT